MKTNLPTSKSAKRPSKSPLKGDFEFSPFKGSPKNLDFWGALKGELVGVFFLLFCLLSCKSPAILTNTDDHHSRDSNYHANYQLIETHDTIVIGIPTPSLSGVPTSNAQWGGFREGRGGSSTPSLCREGWGGSPIIRISDRTRTIHDTTFLLRTDTLLRTRTITQTERYIPPFYKFCTITLASLASLATLYFSIRLLFRYLKIRSPT